jgi:hypothetical protein
MHATGQAIHCLTCDDGKSGNLFSIIKDDALQNIFEFFCGVHIIFQIGKLKTKVRIFASR